MTQLKELTKSLKLSHRELSAALGTSITSVNFIICRGEWPRKNEAELRQKFAALLLTKGLSQEQASAALATGQTQEGYMIRKQMLLPKTKQHFGLHSEIFGADLNSAEDVYLTPGYRYVRESMYHIAKHGGLLAVYGESGSGKSTLRQDLIARLQTESTSVIVIEPYVLGMEENDKKGKTLKANHVAEAILAAVNPEATCASSPQARFAQIHRELQQSATQGNRHVMIIEEAHGMPIALLKQLKRFSELASGFTKLLSIILIGQQELSRKLSERNREVREVVQRMELVMLRPLDDVDGYVRHRCTRAGADVEKLFERDALAELHRKLVGALDAEGKTYQPCLPSGRWQHADSRSQYGRRNRRNSRHGSSRA